MKFEYCNRPMLPNETLEIDNNGKLYLWTKQGIHSQGEFIAGPLEIVALLHLGIIRKIDNGQSVCAEAERYGTIL